MDDLFQTAGDREFILVTVDPSPPMSSLVGIPYGAEVFMGRRMVRPGYMDPTGLRYAESVGSFMTFHKM